MLWCDYIKSLLVQEWAVELLYFEYNYVTWKCVCFKLPKNLKFAVDKSKDTLVTNVNLNRWGKSMNSSLCCSHETLQYVNNN